MAKLRYKGVDGRGVEIEGMSVKDVYDVLYKYIQDGRGNEVVFDGMGLPVESIKDIPILYCYDENVLVID